MTNRARGMALEKILRMEVAFFDKRKSAGALASFLSASTNDLAGVSGSALGVIFICASTTVSGIIVGMAYGWKLALVCLSLFPMLLSSGFFGVWLVGESRGHTGIFSNEAAEFASETLSGIQTIAAMTRQDKALRHFKRYPYCLNGAGFTSQLADILPLCSGSSHILRRNGLKLLIWQQAGHTS